ncbi:site-specific recombinase XerD [Desulfocucumis palustris]|uniref:Site-specific recombinase XerD n=1 Tax=Desulfocucumis palustris TaxID=1898651 RepID=A0A2L2XIR4_9FIRM|nr:tyrosine-type recombinase/integrase [Desulfocucumis palustris]GBF35593.1 site-specific recombinase XerD [Desulfocucumis palustris]
MLNLEKLSFGYMEYCQYQKNLNHKTLKAYNIDLKQFIDFIYNYNGELSRVSLSDYITFLHKTYKPRSIKRKIASVKAFLNYLEYEAIIEENPFMKIRLKIKEPLTLPKTIPIKTIQLIFSTAYQKLSQQKNTSLYQYSTVLRDIAVLELLFATGIRVSELCSLMSRDVDLLEGTIKIYGKGSKERIVQIGNQQVLTSLSNYKNAFKDEILNAGYFFINRLQRRLSEQSVRIMINKYVEIAGLSNHITPHMFRHSFATLLLEEDVDIRFIQKLLGHSSIITTQIYTHVASNKQRDILTSKHPRNRIMV